MFSNIQGKSILYRMESNMESAENADTKSILWKKEYDSKHRLIRVVAGERIYKFEYPETGKNVKMKRIFAGNTEEAGVSLEQLTNFFSIPTP